MDTMKPETLGQQLHDRATRGEILSAPERAQLDEWYARLDQEEGAALGTVVPSTNRAILQAQIQTATAQLAALTQRVQALTAENAAVRQEIVSLQQQLARTPTPQPA
jgi:hypothetical protein